MKTYLVNNCVRDICQVAQADNNTFSFGAYGFGRWLLPTHWIKIPQA